MGGLGSGAWYRWSSKPTVEDGLKFDLARLIRQRNVIPGTWVSGSLVWSLVGSGERIASIGYEADLCNPDNAWMRLHYRNDDEPHDYRVNLTTTRPNYGGRRWWFRSSFRRSSMPMPPSQSDIHRSQSIPSQPVVEQSDEWAAKGVPWWANPRWLTAIGTALAAIITGVAIALSHLKKDDPPPEKPEKHKPAATAEEQP